eukprot:2508488-Pyramimonas_sp.AAC.1
MSQQPPSLQQAYGQGYPPQQHAASHPPMSHPPMSHPPMSHPQMQSPMLSGYPPGATQVIPDGQKYYKSYI